MIGALWNGITGLNTFEKAINVESNNATNVNTVGYKEDVITFEDMMYQNRYGKGVNVETVSKAMNQQGGIKLTNNTYDVAIEGRGYFIANEINQKGVEQTYYTRAGNFKMAPDGFLKTQNDMNILGLSAVSVPANTPFTNNYSKTIASQTVNNPNFVETINTKSTDYLTSAQSDTLANTTGNGYKTKSAKLSDIDMLTADYKSKLALYASNSSATSTPSISQVTTTDYSGFLSNLIDKNDFMKITIDNTEITQQFDTDLQTTLKKFSDKISNVQGLSSSIDSTGLLTINSLVPGKELRIIDAKLNNDDVYPINTVEAKIGSGLGLVESSKNALESALQKAGAQLLTINSKVDLTGQENLNVNKMQLSLSNLKLTNNLGDVEIKDGIVYSKDGENKFVIGKIQTAQFTNEQGLSPIGGNLYQVSKESGGAIYAGNSNKLISSGLEQSKANLGNSLTALLIYQKAFEANSKSITTSDEMLQTAIQLKK